MENKTTSQIKMASIARDRPKRSTRYQESYNLRSQAPSPVLCVEDDIVQPILAELIYSAVHPNRKTRHDGSKVRMKTLTAWKDQFPWLIVERIHGEIRLTCEVCQKAAKACKLTTVWAYEGSGVIQISTVRRHSGCSDHLTACGYVHGGSDNDDEPPSLTVSKDDRVLFNTVYTVAKEELPSEKVNGLLNIHRQNGLDISYKKLSWDTVNGIQRAISRVITQNLVTDIQASPAFAIMLDESTDIRIKRHLTICVRYVKNGEPYSKFLLNTYINEGDSNSIVKCIAIELDKLGICMSKCTCVATDGTPVMMCMNTGVGVQIKTKFSPFATITHCVAHRLNYACSDSIMMEDYLNIYKSKFNELFIFMSSSSNRSTRLLEIQQVLDEPGISVKDPSSVKWMGLRNAVNAVFQSYGAILTTLSSFAKDGNPMAENLFRHFNNYETTLVTGLLLDLHSEIAMLSLELQRDMLTYPEVQNKLDACINKLEMFAVADGPSVTFMKQRIHVDRGLAIFNNNSTLDYRESMPYEFDRLRRDYVEKLKNNLRNRLRREDGDIFTDFARVLEPDVVMKTSKTERMRSVSRLGQYYGFEKAVFPTDGDIKMIPPLLDHTGLENEWKSLEEMISGPDRGYTGHKLCKKIIVHHKNTLPNFGILAAISQVMTVSSPECERSLNAQNRLKVKYRSSLGMEKLDVLLKISLLGPELEHFDPTPAVIKWLSEKKRRKKRLFDDYKPRKKGKNEGSDSERISERPDCPEPQDKKPKIKPLPVGPPVRAYTPHVMESHEQPSLTQSDHVMSSHAQPSHAQSDHVMVSHAQSSRNQSDHALSSHVQHSHTQSDHVLSSHAQPSHTQSDHVLSIHAHPSHTQSGQVLSSHTQSVHVLSSHVHPNQSQSEHEQHSHTPVHVQSSHMLSSHLQALHSIHPGLPPIPAPLPINHSNITPL